MTPKIQIVLNAIINVALVFVLIVAYRKGRPQLNEPKKKEA